MLPTELSSSPQAMKSRHNDNETAPLTPSPISKKAKKTGRKPTRPRPVCKVCGRSFSKPANLRAHERIHTGEKRYGCEVCLRRFVWKSSLNFHSRTAHKDSNAKRIRSIPVQNDNSDSSSTIVEVSPIQKEQSQSFPSIPAPITPPDNSSDYVPIHSDITPNRVCEQRSDASLRVGLFPPYPYPFLPLHVSLSSLPFTYWYADSPSVCTTTTSQFLQDEARCYSMSSDPRSDATDDFQPQAVLNVSISPRECPITTSGAWEDDLSIPDLSTLQYPGDDMASAILSDLEITPISLPSPTIDVLSLESLDEPGEPLTFTF